ncbi:MAG TPA: porin [Lacunisphaera sp.]|nr:porin [Lacunisphaera sp.]
MNAPLSRYPVLLLALAAVSAAAAGNPTIEERLLALERQVQTLAAENAQLKQQLGGKESTPPVLAQPGGKETKVTVGGFLQGQAEFGHASDTRWNGVKDRFFFRRARIYVAGSFAEDFDFKAELDLQGNTLGASTGNLARANEIFINWRKYPAANLRFGQLKPAFGAETLLSDTKMLTIERSLASERLTDGRQLAIGALGDLFGKKLSYYAVVAQGNGSNVSANDNNKFQQSARIVFTPISTAHDKVALGVNGLWTTDTGITKSDLGLAGNLFTGSRSMSGLDAQWTHGPLELGAEWLHGSFRPTGGVSFKAEGWHATAAYFLIPAKLQAVYREESFDPNTATGGNTFRTHLFGLNYYVKGDDIKFGLDYLDGHVPGSTKDGSRVISRVQVIF